MLRLKREGKLCVVRIHAVAVARRKLSQRAHSKVSEKQGLRRLPFNLDAGTLIMNAGSIAALSGFMMSDVLMLRVLSIFG
jgi:hypothetical protein